MVCIIKPKNENVAEIKAELLMRLMEQHVKELRDCLAGLRQDDPVDLAYYIRRSLKEACAIYLQISGGKKLAMQALIRYQNALVTIPDLTTKHQGLISYL